MIPSQLTCPSPEMLDDLLANRLPAAAAEHIRQHIAGCPTCRAKLEQPPDPAHRFPFLSPPEAEGELGRLGGYRILRLLGEGGMAYVFEAEHMALRRRVALKVLKPNGCDASTLARFRHEAEVLASLPHEHIVILYEVGEVDGVGFMAMERLQGETLQDRLERDHWLPLAEALDFAREAAEGLAVAHAKGLVHRDVKPSNLWLVTSPSGRFDRVKLIDFGIARTAIRDSSLTLSGTVVGTPDYMAPEQAAGRPVDARTDIYSLGCVLFRMLTGRTPFHEANLDTLGLLRALAEGKAESSADLGPRFPPAVAELIRQMLALDANERPASAEVLIERLRRLEQEQGATLPIPISPTSRPWSKRRPGQVGIFLGAVTILAALIIGAVAAYHKLAPSEERSETSESEDEGDHSPPPTGKPLKVGILHSLTGTFSIHERPIVQATNLAIYEINKAGGVLGRPIEPIQADGASEEKVFARKAKQLIEQEGVEVLFGCWTASSRKRVADVCCCNDRLLFYPSGCEGLEESPNVVYLGGTPNQTIIPLVRWAYSEQRKRRFFLVGSEYVFSHAVNAILEHELKDLGATLVGKPHYALLGETSFSAFVERIQKHKEANPDNKDMILCSIDGQSNVAFFHALRRAGITPKTIPTVWMAIGESELSLFRGDDMVGDYSVGCYFSTLPGEGNKAFLERFRKRYGAEVRVNDAMETAYFGVYLWKKAFEKSKGGGFDAMRVALRNLTVEAPEGPIRLDARTQHAYRTALVGQIEVHDTQAQFRIVHTSAGPRAPEPFPPWHTPAEWTRFLDGLYKKWDNHWEKHK